jgi:Mrp family chromosome partitioning ATPase
MIEKLSNRDLKDRQRAKRMGVAPSVSLRSHFVSLARQIRRWAASRPKNSNRPLAIGITSLNSGAGKSTVSYNLSAAICSIGRTRTLLVESDFGRHHITRRLGQARSAGLTELLIGVAETGDVIHETPISDLQVMGCGRKSDQEALELPFDNLPDLFENNFSQYGYVVFDLPIANHLTACDSISPFLDGIILTVEANQIDHKLINRFRRNAESFGVDIIGLVINKS